MELVCIRCPIGCHLTVTKKGKDVIVTGNLCPRGEEYGRQEMLKPLRTITTVKQIPEGTVSLKTSSPVDKKIYFDVLRAIKNTPLKEGLKPGDIFIENVLGSGSNLVITGVHRVE